MTALTGRQAEGVRERETVLPATPRAASEARAWLDGQLDGQLGRALLDDVRLVTSELVSNSVLHAGTEVVVVRLRLTAARLRLEVWDEGDGLVARLHSGESRGLALVRMLASRVSSGHRPGWSWVAAEFDLGGRRP